jgi:hypothetical protein
LNFPISWWSHPEPAKHLARSECAQSRQLWGAPEILQNDAGFGGFFSELNHYLNPAALWEPINNKPSQGKLRGLAVVEAGTVLLHPYHITCLKALWPF